MARSAKDNRPRNQNRGLGQPIGGGGGGGNNHHRNRNANRNRNNGGGGGGGGGAGSGGGGDAPVDPNAMIRDDPIGAWNHFWGGYGLGAGSSVTPQVTAFDSWLGGEYYNQQKGAFDAAVIGGEPGNFLDWLKRTQNPNLARSAFRSRTGVEQGYGGAQQARWQYI